MSCATLQSLQQLIRQEAGFLGGGGLYTSYSAAAVEASFPLPGRTCVHVFRGTWMCGQLTLTRNIYVGATSIHPLPYQTLQLYPPREEDSPQRCDTLLWLPPHHNRNFTCQVKQSTICAGSLESSPRVLHCYVNSTRLIMIFWDTRLNKGST